MFIVVQFKDGMRTFCTTNSARSSARNNRTFFHFSVFEEPEDPSSRSFFSEIISSISDVKFSHSGRYMMTRDYLSVKVWDLNMENRPVETYQVSELFFLFLFFFLRKSSVGYFVSHAISKFANRKKTVVLLTGQNLYDVCWGFFLRLVLHSKLTRCESDDFFFVFIVALANCLRFNPICTHCWGNPQTKE